MNSEIILANVAPDDNPAQPNHNNDNPDHALTGKTARLPGDLREQINQRLDDARAKEIELLGLHHYGGASRGLAATPYLRKFKTF
jgi:hypothetical protein